MADNGYSNDGGNDNSLITTRGSFREAQDEAGDPRSIYHSTTSIVTCANDGHDARWYSLSCPFTINSNFNSTVGSCNSRSDSDSTKKFPLVLTMSPPSMERKGRIRRNQRCRQRWVARFVLLVTASILQCFPSTTVLPTVTASGPPGSHAAALDSGVLEFVDETFSCPIRAKCPQVCVRHISECPNEMRCDLDNEIEGGGKSGSASRGRHLLCPDGSCVDIPDDVDTDSFETNESNGSNNTNGTMSIPSSFLTTLLCSDRMESPCDKSWHFDDNYNHHFHDPNDSYGEQHGKRFLSSSSLVACSGVIADSIDACKEQYGYLYDEMVRLFSIRDHQHRQRKLEEEGEGGHDHDHDSNATSSSIFNNEERNPTPSSSPRQLSWTGFWYVVVYAWVTFVSLSIIIWGWYNHRWYPTPGSTKLLKVHDQFQNSNIKADTTELADSRGTGQTSSTVMDDSVGTNLKSRRRRGKRKRIRRAKFDIDSEAGVVEHRTSRMSTTSSANTTPDTSKSFNVYQRGYKMNLIGTILYVFTIFTFFGWYILLAITTSLAYQDDENDEDTILMALQTFCFIYNIGFIWNLMLYWPYSIKSIFYRRCKLSEATIVAVYYFHQHHGDDELDEDKSSKVPKAMFYLSRQIAKNVNRFMSLIFPGEVRDGVVRKSRNEMVQYCRVHRANHVQNSIVNKSGSMTRALSESKPINDNDHRYFVFLYRRYNFDVEKQLFIPGEYSIGDTFSEMLNSHNTHPVPNEIFTADSTSKNAKEIRNNYLAGALSQQQVVQRRNLIGPNQIDMKQPTFYGMFRAEISKPFYLYQFQILWIWVTIQYWYMMIANWCVILISAITISVFRYKSAKVQYTISQVTGMVHVIRQKTHHKHIRTSYASKEFKSAESSNSHFLSSHATTTLLLHQSEVVPGDIIRLQPMSSIHCDMVLLEGEVIVDESALTGEATPHSKIPIDDVAASQIYGIEGDEEIIYDPISLHKRHTLSAGTEILEIPTASGDNQKQVHSASSEFGLGGTVGADERVPWALGMVTHTASFTRKGDLLRDLLAFRKHRVQFELDLPFAVLLLAIYSLILWLIVFFQASDELVLAWSLGL